MNNNTRHRKYVGIMIHVAYIVLPAKAPTVVSGNSCRWQPVFASTSRRLTYLIGRVFFGATRFDQVLELFTEHVDDDEYKTICGGRGELILVKVR